MKTITIKVVVSDSVHADQLAEQMWQTIMDGYDDSEDTVVLFSHVGDSTEEELLVRRERINDGIVDG
jgi:hypothetical protein